MNTKSHWESVYGTKAPEAVSWYAAHLLLSLQYVRKAAPGKEAAIIDVGGGESTLVDDLLADGYSNITVLDISTTALEVTRHRLGAVSSKVAWLAGDVLDVQLPAAAYDVWHDRAVFHFLTSDERRATPMLRPAGAQGSRRSSLAATPSSEPSDPKVPRNAVACQWRATSRRHCTPDSGSLFSWSTAVSKCTGRPGGRHSSSSTVFANVSRNSQRPSGRGRRCKELAGDSANGKASLACGGGRLSECGRRSARTTVAACCRACVGDGQPSHQVHGPKAERQTRHAVARRVSGRRSDRSAPLRHPPP